VHTLVVNAVSGLTPAYIVLPTIALAAALMPSVASCVGAATKFTPNVDESVALTALTLTAFTPLFEDRAWTALTCSTWITLGHYFNA